MSSRGGARPPPLRKEEKGKCRERGGRVAKECVTILFSFFFPSISFYFLPSFLRVEGVPLEPSEVDLEPLAQHVDDAVGVAVPHPQIVELVD